MFSTFVVRPSNTDKDPFRVRLNAVSLLALKLKPGDPCELPLKDPSDNGKKRLAIASDASGAGIKDSVVQTSKLLQDVYKFRLGDKIPITRASIPIPDANVITLGCEKPLAGSVEVGFWENYVRLAIFPGNEYLALSQKLEFRLGDDAHQFVVKDIGDTDSMLTRLTTATRYRITGTTDEPKIDTHINFEPTRLGGIGRQIKQTQDIIRRLCQPLVKQYFDLYQPVQGVLLYGAKGTGKSIFIEALAESGWPIVVRWKPGTKLPVPREPCLVILRSADILRNAGSNRAAEIEDLFQQVRGTATLVVAEVYHPNDIESSLRSEGKFAVEIELPIPSAQQRKEILWALRATGEVPDDCLLQEMAERTHGYVGADLYALLRHTLEVAVERSLLSTNDSGRGINGADDKITSVDESVERHEHTKAPTLHLKSADLSLALQEVRPSALQEIFLETPNVRWTDIGGQHEIKRQLQNAIERPLKFAERMAKLGLRPKKGVLLYGPPGCSKTLLVRALATEAGLNFLAVKGAELISMYVGESERATREVFRKARAASPSIIFFDEIDAIASRGKSGSDLNVLTTLLNEMDGFEELRNVLVVAATNKPQNIDSALMRPGRFDNVVYIGPPDFEARSEIFMKRLQSFQFESERGLEESAKEFAWTTEGFSGAEVVAICQTAAEYAFDADRDYVRWEDMTKAIETTPKSITKDMLHEFETWNAARMR